MSSLDSLSAPPSSPAAALQEWIEAQGFANQKEASLALQWTPPELSMILSGKRPLSDRMARDLAEVLGDVPKYKGWTADDWMELQREFSAWSNRPDVDAEFWAKKKRSGVLCDADISESVKSGLLKIDPFDEDAVQPASYDAKPGTITWFRRQRKGGGRRKLTLAPDQEVEVLPGETVQIVAREKFRLPASIVARMAAPGFLVDMGVHFTFGLHIEPGWSGYPFFLLTHNGDEDLTISAAHPCASVEFEFLERPAKRPFRLAKRDNFAG